MQHILLHIVRNTCRRFSQNQNFLDAFWALSIQPKLKKLWKQRQLVKYFPGKGPRLRKLFRMRTIQPEILDIREQSSIRYWKWPKIETRRFDWMEWRPCKGNQICYQLRARVRAPLKKYLKSNFPLVCSMKSWFNLTDYWKQELCFDLFIILISV